VDEGTVILGVPNAFVKDWLSKKYHPLILKTLRDSSEHIRALEYVVAKSDSRKKATDHHHVIPTDELPLHDHYINKDDNLNPRYTFSNFVVGPFNEFAHAASQAILKKPLAYNPLFIFGSTGHGKTHLIQAIGNHLKTVLEDKKVELIGVEAGGKGLGSGEHASRLAGQDGSAGIAQGYKTMFLQNTDGQMLDTHSVAAGLDYVGVSPILTDLWQAGRVRFEAATDAEVMEALNLTMKKEGIIPALESSHAFVQAYKEAGQLNKKDAIIINMSGRGDKDIFTIAHAFNDPSWKEFIKAKGAEYAA